MTSRFTQGSLKKFSGSEVIERWLRQSSRWKGKFPIEFTNEQAGLEHQLFKLGVISDYNHENQENTFSQEEDQKELADIKDRLDHYIAEQKAVLPEKDLERQTVLKADLKRLKSRFAEQKKYQKHLKARKDEK